MIADVETGASHPLTSPPYSASVPGWSPDGRHLALIGRQNNNETIDLIDAVTGERQPLGSVEGVPSMSLGLPPTWSPDGHWLAVFTDYYINHISSIPRTYMVNVENREVSPYYEYLFGFIWRP
jgi:Tol biopolymer transport system component